MFLNYLNNDRNDEIHKNLKPIRELFFQHKHNSFIIVHAVEFTLCTFSQQIIK